jgi:hypothetical protein
MRPSQDAAELEALKAKVAALEGKLAQNNAATEPPAQEDSEATEEEEVAGEPLVSWQLFLGMLGAILYYLHFSAGPAAAEVVAVHFISLNEVRFDEAGNLDKAALNQAKLNEVYATRVYSLGSPSVLAQPLASQFLCGSTFAHGISSSSWEKQMNRSCSSSPWNLILVSRHRSHWHFTSAWTEYHMDKLDLPEIINRSYTFVSSPRTSVQVATDSFCQAVVQPTVRGLSLASRLLGGGAGSDFSTSGNHGQSLRKGVPLTVISFHHRRPRFSYHDSIWQHLGDLSAVCADQVTVAAAGGRHLVRGEKFDTLPLPTRMADKLQGFPTEWEGFSVSSFPQASDYMRLLRRQDPSGSQTCSAESATEYHIFAQPRTSWDFLQGQ